MTIRRYDDTTVRRYDDVKHNDTTDTMTRHPVVYHNYWTIKRYHFTLKS
jgi:hypothetical protein